MSDDIVKDELVVEESGTFWGEHRLFLLLILTVAVSIALTVVSVVIYNVSGAAQLDLSHPDYQSVSGQVDRETTIKEYSSFGPVNEDTINEFMDLYEEQAKKAKAVDAFNGDPLNPELLEFVSPSGD